MVHFTLTCHIHTSITLNVALDPACDIIALAVSYHAYKFVIEVSMGKLDHAVPCMHHAVAGQLEIRSIFGISYSLGEEWRWGPPADYSRPGGHVHLCTGF